MKSKLLYSLVLSILSLLFIIVLFSCDKYINTSEALQSTCAHSFSEWQTLKITTCVQEGKQVRICSKCDFIETNHIEKEPHDAKKCQTTSPTCLTEGYSVYLCECGHAYTADYVAPLGHSLKKDEPVLKTCSEQGYTHYQCERCEYNFDSNFIPPSHEIEITTTLPTATQNGFTRHACADCSYQYDNDFTKYTDILPSPYVESSVPIYRGIDIYDMEHESLNGNYLPIDWSKIRAQGYSFVILKLGSSYSGKSKTFDMDYEGAKAAGLGVGAYYYAYSSTVEKTRKDAQEALKWIEGKQFEFPIYFDIEDVSLKNIPQNTLTDIITVFIEELQANGYYSGLYTNNEWLTEILDTKTMLERFDIWYARYPQTENPTWNVGKYGKQLSMWQFTDKGIVNGFKTEIDLNYCYRDYPALMKKWGLNGFEKENA